MQQKTYTIGHRIHKTSCKDLLVKPQSAALSHLAQATTMNCDALMHPPTPHVQLAPIKMLSGHRLGPNPLEEELAGQVPTHGFVPHPFAVSIAVVVHIHNGLEPELNSCINQPPTSLLVRTWHSTPGGCLSPCRRSALLIGSCLHE